MTVDVVCLRPEADFMRAGVMPPRNLKIAYRTPDDADVADLLRSAQALVIPAVGPRLAPRLFEETQIKLVQVTGAGVDRLDREALTRRGIPVANVPGGSNNAVAEYAVTCASLLLRRFGWSNNEIRRGDYAGFRARLLSDNVGGLHGMLVGIIGFGVIGRAVAEGFIRAGARVAFHDPAWRGSPRPELDAAPERFDDLISTADVISLHVPMLPQTQNLIGSSELTRMKPGAILINAARGGIVDEAALAASLRSGHLGGAAVDVYSVEPPPRENPLLTLDGEGAERLILTPHIAGVTRQSAEYLFRSAWDNVERVVRGDPPLHRVY